MNFKTGIAAICLTLGAHTAFADQFYIDVGVDNGDNANAQAIDATTTGWFDEMLYEYSSTTLATSPGDPLDPLPAAGSTITTTGGFISGDPGSVATNRVTGFSPGQINGLPLTPSENGFGAGDWGLTFQFSLTGTLGAGLTTDYTSGSITFYYYDPSIVADTSLYIELFTIGVQNTVNSFGGPSITGEIISVGTGSVNGVDAGDVFNFANGSFEDYLDNFIAIIADVDFNTDPAEVDITNNLDGTYTLQGEHDGSISFAVPEPSSLAVLGLGLLGLAGIGRRRIR